MLDWLKEEWNAMSTMDKLDKVSDVVVAFCIAVGIFLYVTK